MSDGVQLCGSLATAVGCSLGAATHLAGDDVCPDVSPAGECYRSIPGAPDLRFYPTVASLVASGVDPGLTGFVSRGDLFAHYDGKGAQTLGDLQPAVRVGAHGADDELILEEIVRVASDYWMGSECFDEIVEDGVLSWVLHPARGHVLRSGDTFVFQACDELTLGGAAARVILPSGDHSGLDVRAGERKLSRGQEYVLAAEGELSHFAALVRDVHGQRRSRFRLNVGAYLLVAPVRRAHVIQELCSAGVALDVTLGELCEAVGDDPGAWAARYAGDAFSVKAVNDAWCVVGGLDGLPVWEFAEAVKQWYCTGDSGRGVDLAGEQRFVLAVG